MISVKGTYENGLVRLDRKIKTHKKSKVKESISESIIEERRAER